MRFGAREKLRQTFAQALELWRGEPGEQLLLELGCHRNGAREQLLARGCQGDSQDAPMLGCFAPLDQPVALERPDDVHDGLRTHAGRPREICAGRAFGVLESEQNQELRRREPEGRERHFRAASNRELDTFQQVDRAGWFFFHANRAADDKNGPNHSFGDDMTATRIPAHVDPARVVDFDFWRPGPPGCDPFLAWRDALHGKPTMVWTPHNGGHWLVTRGADIPKILSDHERFSSRRVFIGMEGAPRSVPLEHDPPEHGPLRKLLMPAFSPRSVKHWADEAQRLAVELIEGFRSAGRCEFMRDFATQLPIIVFLKIVNLPLEHRPMLLDWVSTAIRASEAEARARAREGMNAYMVDLVNRRLREPGDDILSQAINADLGNGQPMSYDMALGTARTLLGGGLDTVASTMGWIALFLADNPGHRRMLAEEPRRIPRAIDELMRRFSIANIARVVKADMEYEGAQLKANEQVLMGTCLHGLDPSCFAEPLRVDFDRRDSHRHSTLSHGIHRCMGAPLALQEIRIFIEEWLKRIPDFEVDSEVPPVKVTGIAHALSQLGLRW